MGRIPARQEVLNLSITYAVFYLEVAVCCLVNTTSSWMIPIHMFWGASSTSLR